MTTREAGKAVVAFLIVLVLVFAAVLDDARRGCSSLRKGH